MGSESQPTDATCAGPNTSWVCADRGGLYTASEMKWVRLFWRDDFASISDLRSPRESPVARRDR